MADFPGEVYSPRTKENKAGVEYDAEKTTINYAEDVAKLDDEVVAIETFLSPKLLTLQPQINWNEIKKTGVPDQVERGIYHGFSMPVYNNDNEELFLTQKVPERWDGASNIRLILHVYLSGAEDVGDKFKFQLSWEHSPHEAIIPETSNDVEVEITILDGRNAEGDEYHMTFTIDYNIDGEGNEIQTAELLAARIRRIAASANEVDNEMVIINWDIEYQRDKFGGEF